MDNHEPSHDRRRADAAISDDLTNIESDAGNGAVSRREFLVGVGAVVVGAGLLGARAAVLSAPGKTLSLPDQPNIVLLITDQERYPQHWPEGWADANLPNRKRLADTGLAFTRAFCNSCMCSPSRSTLMTGLYSARHGVIDTLTDQGQYSSLEQVLPTDMQNMARMLKSAGYNVIYKGKWHLSKPTSGEEFTSQDAAMYGFDGWDPPDAGEDTAPEHFGGGRAAHDKRFTDDAVRFLDEEVDTSKPFALIVSLVNPHDVLAYPSIYEDDYELADFPQGIDLPPTVDEDLSSKPACQTAMIQRTPLRLGALPTDIQKKNYVNFYAYLHKVVDEQIGRIIDALERPRGLNGKESLRKSTIVIRTADHGEMGLSHGGMRQKAFNVYEESLRVPLVVSHPELFPNSVRTDALASLIDLMPTIATIAKVDRGMFEFQGTDLTPLFTDPSGSVQEYVHFVFDDQRAGNGAIEEAVPQPNHIRCIRLKSWKYAIYYDPNGVEAAEYEMYNLDVDPLEVNNLAHSARPEDIQQREELHAALYRAMILHGTLPPALSDVAPAVGAAEHRIHPIAMSASDPAPVVGFTLAFPEAVTMELVDVIGRRIAAVRTSRLDAGEHSVRFDVRLTPGVYFCRMTVGRFAATRKCIVER